MPSRFSACPLNRSVLFSCFLLLGVGSWRFFDVFCVSLLGVIFAKGKIHLLETTFDSDGHDLCSHANFSPQKLNAIENVCMFYFRCLALGSAQGDSKL